MGHADVMKSLLRSAARATSASVLESAWAGELKTRLADLSPLQATVVERNLTRAVGTMPNVAAATVRIREQGISMQLEGTDGSSHMVCLRPVCVSFAPRGAKEVIFAVDPDSAAADGRTLDACSAIAGEIARALWRPVLPPQSQPGEHQAFVQQVKGKLIADLRTVPDVRRACSRQLSANLVEAIGLARITLCEGRILLRLSLHYG